MQNLKFLDKIIVDEIESLWLYLMLIFTAGVVYYLSFETSFDHYFPYFLIFFAVSASGYFFHRNYLFLMILLFLCGGFYAKIYNHVFLDFIKIDGKVFVDGTGRVLEVKKSSLILTDLALCEADFSDDKHVCGFRQKREVDKNHQKKIVEQDVKIKKVRKNVVINSYFNLKNHQEINREFLDKKDSYMNVNWSEIDGENYLPNAPKKILVGVRGGVICCGVNDIVSFRALLKEKNYAKFEKYDKYQKIGSFGFAIGKLQVLEKGVVSSFDQYFLSLRDSIDKKLNGIDDLSSRAIIKAILIGKKSEINDDLKDKIRKSGLAHLLAISGLHLSIVAGIFFVLTRLILVRFGSLAVNYDLKKIAAIIAILVSFFYLKISGSGISAHRAFLMISFGFVATLIDEKPNYARVVFVALILLVLMNPYVLFMVSFQLSFLAVMSVILVSEFWQRRFRENLTSKFISYFILIASTSFLIQLLTFPILIKNFGFVSIISIFANLVAIPFLSFAVMPVAFALLFLMSFGLESYLFGIVTKLIGVFIYIVNFASSFKYSSIALPFKFNEFLVFILVFACFGCFLAKKYLKYFFATVILMVFLCGFLSNATETKDDLIWDKKNKIFAIYDKDFGLIFSKKPRQDSLKIRWMKNYGENELKILGKGNFVDFSSKKFQKIDCNKSNCEIDIMRKGVVEKVLILIKRSKIEDICSQDYDQVINLNEKYLVASCD